MTEGDQTVTFLVALIHARSFLAANLAADAADKSNACSSLSDEGYTDLALESVYLLCFYTDWNIWRREAHPLPDMNWQPIPRTRPLTQAVVGNILHVLTHREFVSEPRFQVERTGDVDGVTVRYSSFDLDLLNARVVGYAGVPRSRGPLVERLWEYARTPRESAWTGQATLSMTRSQLAVIEPVYKTAVGEALDYFDGVFSSLSNPASESTNGWLGKIRKWLG